MKAHDRWDKIIRIRIKVLSLHDAGWSIRAISRELNVRRGSISKWVRIYQKEGATAIVSIKVSSGAGKSKLTEDQIMCLLDILKKDATQQGFPDKRWYPKRVHEVILRQFNVDYAIESINQLLKRYGYRARTEFESNQAILQALLKIVSSTRPSKYGLNGKYWTAKLVTDLSEKLFQRRFSENHIWHYMSKNGFSFTRHKKGLPQLLNKKTAT